MWTAVTAVAWILPIAVCLLYWRQIRKRRLYVAVAAALCLTPTIVYYSYLGVWPLVAALPSYIWYLPGTLKALVFPVIPLASLIGLVAWFLAGRFGISD